MSPLRITLTLLLVVLAPFRGHAASQVPGAEAAPASHEEEYNENWNSHIDNQAYLKRLRQQRDSSSGPSPVIIIERRSKQLSPYHRRPCPYDDCDESWEVEYHDRNSSIIYRENFRSNPYQPILIRPEPRRHKYRYRDPERR